MKHTETPAAGNIIHIIWIEKAKDLFCQQNSFLDIILAQLMDLFSSHIVVVFYNMVITKQYGLGHCIANFRYIEKLVNVLPETKILE